MATEQYDAPQGADKTKVTLTGGGAISGAVRVTVDMTLRRRDVLFALEAIKQRITEGKWPPA